MLLNCSVGKDSWESLGLQGDQTSQTWRKSVLNIHWKDWCWSWSSNTLATWLEELTYWKRPWCWQRLKAEGEGDDRGWDGWMASPTRCTFGWTPGVGDGQGGLACCNSWGRKESNMTEQLKWTELNWIPVLSRVSSFRSYKRQITDIQKPQEVFQTLVVLLKKKVKFQTHSFHTGGKEKCIE